MWYLLLYFAAINILLQVISIFNKKKTYQLRFRISWKLSIIIPRFMKYDCINFERKHMFIYSFGLNPQFFNLEYQKQSPFLQIVLKIPDWYLTEIIFNLILKSNFLHWCNVTGLCLRCSPWFSLSLRWLYGVTTLCTEYANTDTKMLI